MRLAPEFDAAFDAEFSIAIVDLRRRYPDALAKQILLCIIECVQSNSEEPANRLPEPMRQKLVAALHEARPNAVASVLPFSA